MESYHRKNEMIKLLNAQVAQLKQQQQCGASAAGTSGSTTGPIVFTDYTAYTREMIKAIIENMAPVFDAVRSQLTGLSDSMVSLRNEV